MPTFQLLALMLSAPFPATQLAPSPLKEVEHWQVARPGEVSLDAYLVHHEGRLPLVVYIPGSKCVPLFGFATVNGKRHIRGSIPWDFVEGLAGVHVALLERRGLHSGGAADPDEQCTEARGAVRKEVRVQDTVDAVEALAALPFVSKVILVGHSQGSDVAAGVTHVLGNKLTAVGLFSGPGPSQFYDFAANARRVRDSAGVKQAIEDLVRIADPATRGEYSGHDVATFRSFAIQSTPLEDLRETEVPIFVAAGDRDEKSPIESADLFVVEMLRVHPTRHLRYLMLPGLDHGYADASGKEHLGEVVHAFLDWALSAEHPAGVAIGL